MPSLETLVLIALLAGIVLTVVTLGFEADWEDTTTLFRQPGLFIRSILAMNVVSPVVAALLAAAFDLHPAVKIALVALAISPLPPFLPRKEMTAGGRRSYVIGLLVATALLAIVFVPLSLAILQAIFHLPLEVSMAKIARPVATSVLAPLAAGMAVHAFAPALAKRLVRPVGFVAGLMLVLGLLVMLVKLGPEMWELVGNGTLAAMVAFAIIALVAGHLLGGPLPGNRAALALATSARHPGVAMAIASANFPGQKLVMPAILIYALLSMVVSIPYLKKINAVLHSVASGAKA